MNWIRRTRAAIEAALPLPAVEVPLVEVPTFEPTRGPLVRADEFLPLRRPDGAR